MNRALLCLLLLVACGDDDSPADARVPTDAVAVDFGPPPMCSVPAPPSVSCDALPTDYSPGADDMWEPCISDDGTYHRIQESISTIQRVRAFESIADRLSFAGAATPTGDDYLEARRIYQEEEGLDSRVARRYDPRIEVPDGTDCTQDGVPAMFPDYCIGPAVLQPLLLDAFGEGIGSGGRVSAARIEAALLWFLYVSTNKEAFSCTTTAKDCDSSYAYYTGADDEGIGLARYVRRAEASTHARAFDGVLAVRCWRDLDPDEVATDLALRDRARAQLDRALTHGVAQVVRARLMAMCDASTGEDAAVHWAFVRTLARALLPTLPATELGVVEAAIANDDPASVDTDAFAQALDDAYDCP